MKYFLGIIIIIIGFLMMRYPVQITNFTGKIGLAEDWIRFPGAGTYTFWRLGGLLFMILAMLWMFGYLNFF